MQYFPLFILLVIFLVFLTRPLTVLFHELGHAIPAIVLTKEKVTVYIGSYGDPKKSLRINIRLLEIFFQFNPFAWRLGLCVPSAKEISINRQIIYTITGPIASFIVASIACYFTFSYDQHGFLKLLFIVFLGSSLFDLVVNLIPIAEPIKLYDGTIAHNDGYSLKQLFYYNRFDKKLKKAFKLFNENRYSEASKLFDKLLTNGFKDENVYRLAISSFLQDKNYKKAKELSDEFMQLDNMNSDDLSNAALAYSLFDQSEKAIELYDQSLIQNPNNKYSWNNKGYTLNLLNRYEEAIPLFDKAIEIDKDFAYSYNNRGLSKIKLGQIEEGLKDINYSIELDVANSYAYMHLGIYYFDASNYSKALELFTKAKELDSSTHKIDEHILEAKKHL